MNKQYFFKIVIVLCIITFTQIRVTEQKLKDFSMRLWLVCFA